MKKKQVELKKLTLNKEKIVMLTNAEKQAIVGGVKAIAYKWSFQDPCSLRPPTQQ